MIKINEHAYIWLFDLDNTLHQADYGVFELINCHMTAYLAKQFSLSLEDASQLRSDYWERYGATLVGLKKHHPEINLDEFLYQSHPLEKIIPSIVVEIQLHRVLSMLCGKKYIFSNGPSFYIKRILDCLEIGSYFDGTFGCDDLGYLCKPNINAYVSLCAVIGAEAQNCIMVDDSIDNLMVAKSLGMKTIWYPTKGKTLEMKKVDFSISSLIELIDFPKKLGIK